MSDHQIRVDIDGSASGFSNAARTANADAGRFVDSLGRLREANGRFVGSGRQTEQAMNGIGTAARSAGGGIGIMGIALGQIVASAAISAIKNGLQALGETMIGYNARMEQARIGFTSLLGSADAAAVFISQMQDFAAKTPFEFPQVQDAAKRFLAFGFAAKEVIPTLTAVGDAVSAMGGSSEMMDRVVMAMGQIKSKGRVQAEELLQLAEAGIPAYQILADKLNLTGQEVANIGEKGISAEVALKALTEGMGERFGGMMEAQSKSFTGIVSNLKDNAQMLAAGLGESLFEKTKAGLQSVMDLTNKMVESFRAGGFQQVFKDLVPADLQPKIQAIANAFLNFGETVYNVGAKIMASIQEAFGKSGDSASKWLPILERVASALVTLIGGAVQVVVMWFGVFADTASEAADWVVAAWGKLGEWFNTVVQAIGQALQWLQDNVVGPVAEAFGSSAEAVAGIWEELRVWIVTKTSEMVRGILQALGPLGKAIGTSFGALGDAWNALAGPKADTFGAWANSAKKSTTNVAKGLTDLANHKARTMEMGGDKASKAADKEEKEAQRVSEAIEKAWTKQTETKLQLNDRWMAEQMEALEKTRGANENYERDKLRVVETHAARRSDILQKQAKEEREIREQTASALADIDKKTQAGYLGHSTGSEGKRNEMEAAYKATLAEIDSITKKREEANAKSLADYGVLIESQEQIDQDSYARKLSARAKYLADLAAYNASAQKVEDDLKAARDANNLAEYAKQLSAENAMKLAQHQEQQTMMDMLYKWTMEANMTMTTFMLQQADAVKNSLASGIAQSIVYGKNLGETLANIGKQVAAAFIEMMIKQALAAALGQSLQKMMMATTTAAAAAIAAAWAPAAFLAAVATQGSAIAFGGLAIAGAAGSGALLGAMQLGMSAGSAGGGVIGGAPIGQPSGMGGLSLMATGGIVTGPTLALIGEGRADEAVIPLDRDTLAGYGLGGSNQVNTMNIYGDIKRDVDQYQLYDEFSEMVAAGRRG